MTTSPRPWRVIYDEWDGEREVQNIVDANGEVVVETDAGFYPPRAEDAELIVKAVNAYGAVGPGLYRMTLGEAKEKFGP